MTERSSGGKTPIVLAALAGLGLLIAKNADTCFKGAARVGGDVASVSKAGDAVEAAARAGRAADATDAGRVINAVDALDAAGWIVDGVGLTADAFDYLSERQLEDAELPEEEWGWQEADGEMPSPVGTWCATWISGERQTQGYRKRLTLRKDGVAVGEIQSLAEDARVWQVEEKWSPKEVCTRQSRDDTDLDAADWTCRPLLRLTDRHVSVQQEKSAMTWIRCGA
jgi:hypothetical protein